MFHVYPNAIEIDLIFLQYLSKWVAKYSGKASHVISFFHFLLNFLILKAVDHFNWNLAFQVSVLFPNPYSSYNISKILLHIKNKVTCRFRSLMHFILPKTLFVSFLIILTLFIP